MNPLFAIARQGEARVALVREIQAAVTNGLYSQRAEKSGWGQLDGPLGEQIAIAAGHFSLEFVSPEQIAEGFVSWLDKYFLSPPQGEKDGPREGNEDASPPPCSEGADGSRVGAPPNPNSTGGS